MPLPLTSSTPEHVSQSAWRRSGSSGRDGRDEVEGGLLVRAAEGAYAVGTGIVADYPKASREFGGRQRRHVAGPALNVLLPAGFQCGNTGTLRRYHSVGVVQYRIAGAKPNGCGVVGQRVKYWSSFPRSMVRRAA